MTFVYALQNTSFVINKNGKVYAWGDYSSKKRRPETNSSDIVVSIIPAAPWENAKFKSISGRGKRFALVSFENELFTLGKK